MVGLLWKAATAGLFVLAGEAAPMSGEGVECVDAESESAEKGMLFKIHNQCAAPVSCTVTWQLRCGSEDNASQAQTRTIPIWSQSDGTVNASAASCNSDTWAIESPSWSCQAQSK